MRCSTGELPFAGDSPLALAVRKMCEAPVSPRRFAPALRPCWERCVLRCLQPDPKKRFARASEVLMFVESRSLTVLSWKLAQRSVRRPARGRRLIAGAAAVAALWFARRLWPRSPAQDAVQQGEGGIFSLHAGEPLLAVQVWEERADGRHADQRQRRFHRRTHRAL